MSYPSLEACLIDLERNGQLIRIQEEVDPYLEMAAIHLRVHEMKGPALLFENLKGCRFQAASNIFGTLERSRIMFRGQLQQVQELIELKNNPASLLKNPLGKIKLAANALKSIPLQNPIGKPILFEEIKISDLPQIQHWPMDGGAFVTLPQVYSEDVDQPGIAHANIGMYRIQLSGNEYISDKEIGLHYQLHRGIGVHQTKANQKNQPLKVSVFVGGPPAHSVAAVMPLPEGISEARFAGALGGRRFRYFYQDGYCISSDADFVITGEVMPMENKPEGPFGDHLGYYSLAHPFPVMRVHKVYARKNAIWPFTVVGRPPQEDTSFGALIHEIAGTALQAEIPGLKEVNAVDPAGVHPLLLAIGSERYTPYAVTQQPAELLTIANHILGTGQLSLAKFLFITADDEQQLSTHDIGNYFRFVLERIDLKRDVHFYTQTTIDTLDYSGEGLNSGSKVVFAAYGKPLRSLGTEAPSWLHEISLLRKVSLVLPGILALQTSPFSTQGNARQEMQDFSDAFLEKLISIDSSPEKFQAQFPMIILCDDPAFVSAHLNNFLWVTFTRCNPSHDIYGIDSFQINKHWGANGPLIIDARIKPHHAPPVEKDPKVEARVNRLFEQGGSLFGLK